MATAKKTAKKSTKSAPKKQVINHFLKGLIAFGGYFKGAWYELRQVRWPNRRATWSLTLAVIIFSVILGVLIVLCDILFKYLFELILQ